MSDSHSQSRMPLTTLCCRAHQRCRWQKPAFWTAALIAIRFMCMMESCPGKAVMKATVCRDQTGHLMFPLEQPH